MQLTHAPLVSHAAAAIMSSPAMATPAGSPASAPPPPHPPHHPSAVPNQPCSTLFIANLGHNVTEHEIKDIFSRLVYAEAATTHDENLFVISDG